MDRDDASRPEGFEVFGDLGPEFDAETEFPQSLQEIVARRMAEIRARPEIGLTREELWQQVDGKSPM